MGFSGRFGAGPAAHQRRLVPVPPAHDLEDAAAPEKGGSRIAIVFNGSPLFTGDAGCGESDIRRWIIENDWLEAIVALPDQLFYNTGISTYIWIVTNRKEQRAAGQGPARSTPRLLREDEEEPRQQAQRDLSTEHIAEITRIYGARSRRTEHVARSSTTTISATARSRWSGPLRLSFQATPSASSAFGAVGLREPRHDQQEGQARARRRSRKGSSCRRRSSRRCAR